MHALTAGFFTMTTWWVAGGLALTAVALLSGSGRRATAIRAAVRIGGLPACAVPWFPAESFWPGTGTHHGKGRGRASPAGRTAVRADGQPIPIDCRKPSATVV